MWDKIISAVLLTIGFGSYPVNYIAISQPISTDPLNSPDHSLSHRVIANDSAAPDKAVVVNADGNVGIGTTSPLTKLSIQGTAGTDLMNVALPTTGASALYVAEDGNMGIGTESPDGLMHLKKDFSGILDLVISNETAEGNRRILFKGYRNSVYEAGAITSLYVGGGNHAHLTFSVCNNDVLTEEMRITNLGNIGIGTTSPLTKLSIQGTAGTDLMNVALPTTGASALYVAEDGKVGIGTDSPDRQFKVMGSGTQTIEIKSSNGTSQMILNGGSNQIARFLFQEGGSNRWFVSSDGTDSDKFKITDGSQNEIFVLTDAGTKSDVSINQGDFFIQNSGNIGIGTTSPNRILGIGGLVTRNIGMERGTVANTAGFDLTLNAGGATSAATDKAGGDLILQSGIATGDGGSEMELQIAEASQGAGTADRSPTTVVKINNTKSTLIGDGGTTNYTKFASDGELGLYGTARVKRHTRVGAGSWCGGTSAPTQGCEGAFMYLEFDNSTDDEAYYVLPIPARWDNTTDIEFSIDWYYTGTQDNGTVCWALEYKSIKDGEAITGGETTIAQTSAGNHTTGQMIRTTFTTDLLAANLERGDTIGLRVFRDVDGGNDSGDTLATNARGINTHFRFIMNRLGDAT